MPPFTKYHGIFRGIHFVLKSVHANQESAFKYPNIRSKPLHIDSTEVGVARKRYVGIVEMQEWPVYFFISLSPPLPSPPRLTWGMNQLKITPCVDIVHPINIETTSSPSFRYRGEAGVCLCMCVCFYHPGRGDCFTLSPEVGRGLGLGGGGLIFLHPLLLEFRGRGVLERPQKGHLFRFPLSPMSKATQYKMKTWYIKTTTAGD